MADLTSYILPSQLLTSTVNLQSGRISELIDVDLTNLSDGAVLVYNGTTLKFTSTTFIENPHTTIDGGSYSGNSGATILTKNSDISGGAPTISDIKYGELTLNYADGRLYYRTANDTIRSFTALDNVPNLITDNTFVGNQTIHGSLILKNTTSDSNLVFEVLNASDVITSSVNGLGNAYFTSINDLHLTSNSTGFSISGGTVNKTLTVSLDASVSGINTGDQTITLTGDVLGSGTGSFETTLKDTGTSGTYKSVTTDSKGRVTSGSNPTTLAGYGITDAATSVQGGKADTALQPSTIGSTVEAWSANLDTWSGKTPYGGTITLASGQTLAAGNGGTLGTAAFTDSTSYDAAGLAASAESSAKSYADGLVIGLLDDRGNFDASVNTFPTSGGSGTSGAILKGDLWRISVISTSGPLLGYSIGSSLRALKDSPTSSDWGLLEGAFPYTPEDVSNKSQNIVTDLASTVKYPSTKAVYDWATGAFAPGSGGTYEVPLTFVSPISRNVNTISLKGLTGFGTSYQALCTNATTDGLEWRTFSSNPGTVTSVSVTSANGVSGSVSNPTSTPAITISLGVITPTSVNGLTLSSVATGFTIAGGTISKTLTVPLDASVSGTNTGDNAVNSNYSSLVSFPGFGTDHTHAAYGDDSRIVLGGTSLQPGSIGSTVEAWSANLDTWSGKTPYAGSLTITSGQTLNVTTGGTLGSAAFTNTGAYEVPISVTTPLSRSSNTISLNGLTTFGTAGQVIRTNATTNGLEWYTIPASSSTLQQAYNASSNPEIATNDTLGAVTLKSGATSGDTATVLEVIKSDNSTSASISGLGTGSFNQVQLNTSPTIGTYSEGKVYYDSTNKNPSADVGNNITLGLTKHLTSLVYNNTGTTLSAGKVVKISSSTPGKLNASLALAGVIASVPFTCTGGVVTITLNAHAYPNGVFVDISQSNNTTSLPNGFYAISNVTTNTFDITAGSGVASGTCSILLPNQVSGVVIKDITSGSSGLIMSVGKLENINTSAYSVGDILYLSDTVAGEYVAGSAGLQFSSRTNKVGFVTQKDASTGQIYISIENENTNFSINDTQKNILAGNVLSSGVYDFAGVTVNGADPTHKIDIPSVRGWIVSNTGPYYSVTPSVVSVYFAGQTNVTLTNLGTAPATYILITPTNQILQQTTYPTPQQRRDNIFLSKIVHPGTTIITVNNTTDYDTSPMSALRDMFTPIPLINDGIVCSPNGANLNFNRSGGNLYGMGINWASNQKNPNQVMLAGASPVTFFYRTRLGGSTPTTTTVDPTHYDLNGVVTSLPTAPPAGNEKLATNQRIYLFPTNIINVQYGQAYYKDMATAIAATQTETFVKSQNVSDTAILLGILTVRNGATNLSLVTDAIFTPASIFGESIGGVNGISTTTLQQAYNNSVTPEITTNDVLGAVSIKSGATAGDSAVIFETVNSSDITTSSITGLGVGSFSKIGIGTNPTEKLSVVGNITATGNIVAGSVDLAVLANIVTRRGVF